MIITVYILQSELDNSYYIGSTVDLKRRLWEHNNGQKGYTKKKRPWKLVYQEVYNNKKEALKREKYLKRLKSKEYIGRLIRARSSTAEQ